MYKPDHITTVKTVKIYAPFPLKANERMVIVNGKAINVAASAGRQQGDYLYSATLHCCAKMQPCIPPRPAGPAWRWNEPTHWTARMRDHALSLELFNPSKQGDRS